MNEADPNPAKCPLCGRANECGMAAGKGTCWCFDVKLDPRALEKLPEAARGKACVCKACGALREAPTNAPTKP